MEYTNGSNGGGAACGNFSGSGRLSRWLVLGVVEVMAFVVALVPVAAVMVLLAVAVVVVVVLLSRCDFHFS